MPNLFLCPLVTGLHVYDLMSRLRVLVDALPPASPDDLLAADEQRVDLSRDDSDSFEILSDLERYPGQFRVVGEKLEKVRYGRCECNVRLWDRVSKGYGK